jgi:hypothetical protein
MGALFAGALSTGLVCVLVNLSRKRNQQTWWSMRLEEGHLGMVILYPMFFQSIIHLNGRWIVELISMCVFEASPHQRWPNVTQIPVPGGW